MVLHQTWVVDDLKVTLKDSVVAHLNLKPTLVVGVDSKIDEEGRDQPFCPLVSTFSTPLSKYGGERESSGDT